MLWYFRSLRRLERKDILTIIIEVSLVVVIMLINPFNLEADMNEMSRSSFMKIYSPFYQEDGQKEIVVIMINDNDVKEMWPEDTGDTWPMDYLEYHRLMEIIIDQEPRAIFVDIIFDTIRSRMPTANDLALYEGGHEYNASLLQNYAKLVKEKGPADKWDAYDLFTGLHEGYTKHHVNHQFLNFKNYIKGVVENNLADEKKPKLFFADSFLPSTVVMPPPLMPHAVVPQAVIKPDDQYRPALVKELKDTGVGRVTYQWIEDAHVYPLRFDATQAYKDPYWRTIIKDFPKEASFPTFVHELETPAVALYREYLRDKNIDQKEKRTNFDIGHDMTLTWGLRKAPDSYATTEINKDTIKECYEQDPIPYHWTNNLYQSGKIFFMGFFQKILQKPASNYDSKGPTWDQLQRCFYNNNYSAHQIFEFAKGRTENANIILKDKLVILGANIVGIDDKMPSYIHGQVPGAFLHAMALDNLITHKGDYFIDPPSPAFGISISDIIEICLLLIGSIYVTSRIASKEYQEYSFWNKMMRSLCFLFLTTVFLIIFMAFLAVFFHFTPINWLALLSLIAVLSLGGLTGFGETLDKWLRKKTLFLFPYVKKIKKNNGQLARKQKALNKYHIRQYKRGSTKPLKKFFQRKRRKLRNYYKIG